MAFHVYEASSTVRSDKRVNRDRADRLRVAGGEASESKGSLETAVAFEYVERSEILAAFDLADRICTMTFRLTHQGPGGAPRPLRTPKPSPDSEAPDSEAAADPKPRGRRSRR